MPRSIIVLIAVIASAAVGVAKPAAMDGAVNCWEQFAAKVAAFDS